MSWTKRDRDPKKIVGGYLNDDVVKRILRLESKGYFDEVIGVENEGKESVIIRVAREDDGKKTYRIVKVHRIEAHKFQRLHQYILGDPRFAGIKLERRSLVFTWTKKEFSNLKRAFEVGVSCPEPYAFLDNIIVMSVISEKDGTLSPKLKDVEIENMKKAEKLFMRILDEYKKLYQGAKIVHTDLSEFNILLKDSKTPVIIDFAQGVRIDHPKSEEFLERDIHNLCRYFKKIGVEKDEKECMDFVKKSFH